MMDQLVNTYQLERLFVSSNYDKMNIPRYCILYLLSLWYS